MTPNSRRDARILDLDAQGKTLSEIADAVWMSTGGVCLALRRLGRPARKMGRRLGGANEAPTPRVAEMLARRRSGKTYQAVADQFGVTWEAVHQSVKHWARRT